MEILNKMDFVYKLRHHTPIHSANIEHVDNLKIRNYLLSFARCQIRDMSISHPNNRNAKVNSQRHVAAVNFQFYK
jgi:hypothetical protein